MDSKIINPFITVGYEGPEYFCDRERETADVIRLLTNGNNIALISPRRYGKTNLIEHCFAQPQIKDHYYTFLIDIYSTKSEAEFVNRLGACMLETLKPMGRKVWEKFIAILKSVQNGISYDNMGNPSWSVRLGDIPTPRNTMDEIFSYIEQADKPCLIAIDEFQQITRYGDETVEAALRTYVQHCHNAKFIFSGSHRHMMGLMFTSPARPFFQSASLYNLPLLPEDKYTEFCVRLFGQDGKHVSPEVPHALYERFEGITFYMQRVMNELYSITPANGQCTTEDIEQALQNIIAASAITYEDLLYQLPEKQSIILQAIARDGKAKNLTSGDFVRRHGLLSASSVKSAVPALLDRGLVTCERGVYQLYDKFMEIWLQHRF